MIDRPIALNTVHCCDWRDLLASLGDHSVDLIATDMPYGTTACSWDTVIDLDAWWVEAHRVAKPRAAIVCTGSQPFTSRLVMSNVENFRYEWVWEKPVGSNFLDARRMPLKCHENILIFGGANYHPQLTSGTPYTSRHKPGDAGDVYGEINHYKFDNPGFRFPRSVQKFDHQKGDHPTQKPVDLFSYLIRTYTQPGDLVLDPFCGSGTTALAARACGRAFLCGDSDAGYVAIARDRLRLPFEARQVQQATRLDDLPLFRGLGEGE